jgi:hypothetical protein
MIFTNRKRFRKVENVFDLDNLLYLWGKKAYVNTIII